ncbi:hypothetical protein EBQ93_00105 [bacterium]|nr:hypothetical protein [bacterium]
MYFFYFVYIIFHVSIVCSDGTDHFPARFINKIGQCEYCCSGVATALTDESAFKELAFDIADCSPEGACLLEEKFATKLLGIRPADAGKVISSIVLLNMYDLTAFYGNVRAFNIARKQGIPFVWPWQDEAHVHALHIKIAAQQGHWEYIQKVFTPEQQAAAEKYLQVSLCASQDGKSDVRS